MKMKILLLIACVCFASMELLKENENNEIQIIKEIKSVQRLNNEIAFLGSLIKIYQNVQVKFLCGIKISDTNCGIEINKKEESVDGKMKSFIEFTIPESSKVTGIILFYKSRKTAVPKSYFMKVFKKPEKFGREFCANYYNYISLVNYKGEEENYKSVRYDNVFFESKEEIRSIGFDGYVISKTTLKMGSENIYCHHIDCWSDDIMHLELGNGRKIDIGYTKKI